MTDIVENKLNELLEELMSSESVSKATLQKYLAIQLLFSIEKDFHSRVENDIPDNFDAKLIRSILEMMKIEGGNEFNLNINQEDLDRIINGDD